MSKRNIILLHVFTWLFAAFLNLKDYTLLADPEHLSIYIVSTAFLAVPFYLFYLLVVPRYLEKKRYYLFFIVALSILLVLPFVGYSILLTIRALFRHDFHHFYGIYSLRMHLSGLSVVSLAATFGAFFRVLLNWLNTVNQKEILEKEKAVSELALMKSKVNPHFLFNTLNNIDVLIHEDPDKASQSLLKLSAIMRYMSYETVSDFVSLSREIGYISDIVSLYALRVNDPRLIRLNIPGKDPGLDIAPMLFVPFIENAFKYATFKGENPGIEIGLTAEGKTVHFTTANRYDIQTRPAVAERGGTGLANVRQRLEHLYPGNYRLDIHDNNGFFKVELTINTHGN